MNAMPNFLPLARDYCVTILTAWAHSLGFVIGNVTSNASSVCWADAYNLPARPLASVEAP
ncbi:MAG TPA: hypothetical protein VEH04_00190 [Verrucomicrobiae bacterium]|nr:hypothetical protein [Verrucomicrobiae bacterium]